MQQPGAGGTARVVHAHTGAEFEDGTVHRARGVNEPHPGVVPEPAGPDPRERRPQPGPQRAQGQPRLQTFFGIGAADPAEPPLVGAPGRQRAKKQKTT